MFIAYHLFVSCDPFGVVSVFCTFYYKYITPSGLIQLFMIKLTVSLYSFINRGFGGFYSILDIQFTS